MEILRDQWLGEELTGLKSRCFGTLEELEAALKRDEIPMPCVLKPASGSMSQGVARADTPREVLRQARLLSRTPHRMYEFRDFLRAKKIRGYRRDRATRASSLSSP